MKKICFLIITVSLMLSANVFAADANRMSNVTGNAEAADSRSVERLYTPSEWAETGVMYAEKIGIVNAEEKYNYTNPVMREEFCELIYNYITNISDGPTAVYTKNQFKDTENEHIAVLNGLGIINGKSETEFAPNDLLTREEAAVILFRLINTVHYDWAAHELYFEFSDSKDISDWAMNNIQTICNMGIMYGMEDNKFAPKDNYTAEQAIVTLVRTYFNFNGEEFENAENKTYSDIENLQNSVYNGHFPWRTEYKEVIMSFLSGKGEDVENLEIISCKESSDSCSAEVKVGGSIYRVELFKPIRKNETGIWIVKSCEKSDIIGGADGITEIIVE